MNCKFYVTKEEFTKQVFEVEGINIDITQFNPKLAKVINKLRYPSYPYKDKFDGDEGQLVAQRIAPLLNQYIIAED